MGTQKNCLIEMVVLSTQNIHIGWEIREMSMKHALLSASGPLTWDPQNLEDFVRQERVKLHILIIHSNQLARFWLQACMKAYFDIFFSFHPQLSPWGILLAPRFSPSPQPNRLGGCPPFWRLWCRFCNNISRYMSSFLQYLHVLYGPRRKYHRAS